MGRIRKNSIQVALKKFGRRPSEKLSDNPYSRFDLLDGQHPWQDVVPEGHILYPTRELKEGDIAYFNFKLAKEMGLIPKNHPNKMTRKLQKKLVETFSLRIVNEYDEKHNITFHPSVMKKHGFMATRYLQLQHVDKTGRTSGDGRCIWNGCIEYNGKMWDVSSRGTGVTALAPGAVEAGEPLQSGNTDFGYGCGLADIDELIGSAIMAESFYNNGINTERMLCVIDIGKNAGIGVRAGQNLIRPAHLFNFLKQGEYEPLKRSTDYLIERQFKNGEWDFSISHPRKYEFMLQEMCETFAHFAATLDRDYIFAWLDWDGDNVLANGGIIDYGSIRQFGLRHDQYRYDDVDRFSTNLNEQASKAKQIVQAFAQLADFLKNKKKRPIGEFSHHPILKQFDESYEFYSLRRFLAQIGFKEEQQEELLDKKYNEVRDLYKSFSVLESTKTRKKLEKVADGLNRPAIINMRKGLQHLVEHYNTNEEAPKIEDFFKVIIAKSAIGQDRRMRPTTKSHIREFFKRYEAVVVPHLTNQNIKGFQSRCEKVNRPDRITGDGLIHVVEKIMKVWKHGRTEPDFVQKAIENMISDQSPHPSDRPQLHRGKRISTLTNTLLSLVDGYKESI